jgi:hypothetical protein
MNRLVLAFLAGLLALVPTSAISQQKSLKDQLVGTWHLVSWDARMKDGSKVNPMGAGQPKGAIIFDAAGGFYFIVVGEIPKLA